MEKRSVAGRMAASLNANGPNRPRDDRVPAIKVGQSLAVAGHLAQRCSCITFHGEKSVVDGTFRSEPRVWPGCPGK